MNTFAIEQHQIGGGARCFVIAEAGVNHNGDAALAEQLIDAAADAGADAIKFQTFDPSRLASASARTADYQKQASADDLQLPMLKKLVLPHAAYPPLKERAASRGLVFLSTPFDNQSADFLLTLGVPAFKVSSGDLTNTLLLGHLARKGRPIILSTGMADLNEVRTAVAAVTDRAPAPVGVAVLHCVSNYPAAMADLNLRAIPTMASALKVPVGFSDHTTGEHAAVAAVTLGAAIVEKHLTLDRSMPGPDHKASLDPQQFRSFVAAIRDTAAALGTGEKVPAASERENAQIGRRSLFWSRPMRRGTVVTESDLVALRPGGGLAPDRWPEFVGRVLRGDVIARAVRPEDVE
ncbi:MAG: N-acetylneuraminate synthase family protein [Cyanobacteria bacterium]|nr:N-acetylneuraminate synthase family protein [Cyanobacteriota bacterium]